MTSPPAIVLVGGLGTRLRDLYPDRPKALVPVRGRPFIAWMLDWLRAQGVERIHLAAGHLAHKLVEWRAAEPPDDRLTVSQELMPLGTGGGLRFALDFIAGAELLVLNGDSFLPSLDLRAWLAAPLADGLDGALAATRIETPGRYGTVEFGPDHRVSAFLEKADRPAGWVNGGVYRLRRAVLERIPADRAVSLETEVFPAAARTGALAAHPTPPPLLDMGTPDGLRAMEDWLDANPQFFQRL
ncbi:MAG TPA: sugar phosphate nucleotidyltransferase [Kiritimatiellia bacterium]|nr:sugar phosphate nucleotidyltransferase [Kiritimatiellia bacterium]